MTDTKVDEWSLLSHSYEDVLLPRFERLYHFLGQFLVDQIKSNRTKAKFKLLDYGTGPGEPLLTIAKLCHENQMVSVEFHGFDSSRGMISIAKERFNNLKMNDLNIEFDVRDNLSNCDQFDVIVSSLVLPYASNKRDLLREFYEHINDDGLCLTCHWPDPSEVPFLSLLKRIGMFMSDGKQISTVDLQSNVSFSCSDEVTTRQMFTDQGFLIKQWLSLDLPMLFPNTRTFLSFLRIAPWFADANQFAKAEQETKRILHEEYDLPVDFDGSFQLPSHVIIVIASK